MSDESWRMKVGDLLEKRRRVMQQWATHCATPVVPADRSKVVALRGAGHE
jgi:hypothetical protein